MSSWRSALPIVDLGVGVGSRGVGTSGASGVGADRGRLERAERRAVGVSVACMPAVPSRMTESLGAASSTIVRAHTLDSHVVVLVNHLGVSFSSTDISTTS